MKIKKLLTYLILIQTLTYGKQFVSFDNNFLQAQSFIEDAKYTSFDSINKIFGYNKTGNFAYYILESYKDFAILYTNETPENIHSFVKNTEKRAIELEKYKQEIEVKYVLAEINFHLGVFKLLQGNKKEAVFKIIESYNLVTDIEKKQPNFILHRKLLGIYHIGLGYLPTYILKIIKIVGIKGDIKKGLEELESCNNTKYYFYNEVNILKTTLSIFAKNSNKNEKETIIPTLPNRFWYNYLVVLMYKKIYKNELALSQFDKLPKNTIKNPIFAYQKANLLLNKLEINEAAQLFQFFIEKTKGKNYIKDALYKSYLCNLINNQKTNFESIKIKIKQQGTTITEVDKKAQKLTTQVAEPLPELVKTMLLMDGGYFEEAEKILNAMKQVQKLSIRNKTEYYYRKARILELQNKISEAEKYYLQTIDIQGIEPFYFAPNSCLQLALLYQKSNTQKSILYSKKVLSYKKHEYKNSLDTKAKIILKQLYAE